MALYEENSKKMRSSKRGLNAVSTRKGSAGGKALIKGREFFREIGRKGK